VITGRGQQRLSPTCSTDRQPELALPFAPGESWSLTGGPTSPGRRAHPAVALDFAPITG
jgi:hypothetical protein